MSENKNVDKNRPFMFLNEKEHIVVSRPMVGDKDTVFAVHEWLLENSIKNEIHFPSRVWWLEEDKFTQFLSLYSHYVFPK